MAEGYKDWAAGDILTAADLEDYTVKQSVMRFADASARTTALSGVVTEGMMSYLKDTDSVEVYDGSAWAVVGPSGLVHISRTTVGSAVSSVTVSNAFSADYDSYKIIVAGGAGSVNLALNATLGATTTGYGWVEIVQAYSSPTPSSSGNASAAAWNVGRGDSTVLSMVMEIQSPFLAKYTVFQSSWSRSNNAGRANGYLGDTTSYTDFTITASVGTMTGGTIDVYGYAKA